MPYSRRVSGSPQCAALSGRLGVERKRCLDGIPDGRILRAGLECAIAEQFSVNSALVGELISSVISPYSLGLTLPVTLPASIVNTGVARRQELHRKKWSPPAG